MRIKKLVELLEYINSLCFQIKLFLTRSFVIDIFDQNFDNRLRTFPGLTSIHGLHQQLVLAPVFAIQQLRRWNLAWNNKHVWKEVPRVKLLFMLRSTFRTLTLSYLTSLARQRPNPQSPEHSLLNTKVRLKQHNIMVWPKS